MIPPRKPRSDSVLKMLPAEAQAEIIEYTRTHSLRDTAEWLAGGGIKTGGPEISKFLKWHAIRQQSEEDQTAIEAIVEETRRANPLLGDRELNSFGQRMFALQAIHDKDLRGFVALRKLALAREIYEFSAAAACRTDLPYLKAIEADETIADGKKTELFAEKIYGRPLESAPVLPTATP